MRPGRKVEELLIIAGLPSADVISCRMRVYAFHVVGCIVFGYEDVIGPPAHESAPIPEGFVVKSGLEATFRSLIRWVTINHGVCSVYVFIVCCCENGMRVI